MMDEKSQAFSALVVALFKGVINRETDAKHWLVILTQRAQVEDYVAKIGLTLVVDETDGYAYLKQQTETEDHLEIPRLIPRYALSYHVSLLLVLLRKQLIESDSHNSAERYIISKREIFELLKPYLKTTSNEAKQLKKLETDLNKIKEMGFIRSLENSDENYEVMRIIRGFVDAQWLGEMDDNLSKYKQYAQPSETQEEGENEPV